MNFQFLRNVLLQGSERAQIENWTRNLSFDAIET